MAVRTTAETKALLTARHEAGGLLDPLHMSHIYRDRPAPPQLNMTSIHYIKFSYSQLPHDHGNPVRRTPNPEIEGIQRVGPLKR